MRPAAASAVLGLALAIGIPTAWNLTRPAAAAGAEVEQALESPSPRAATPPAPVNAGPVRLEIPALSIDALVDPVGVRPDGQMSIPDDVDQVGWYRFGPAPGADGSAVLAGHVDDREQGLGALAPLRDAAVGQEVVVTDAEGTSTRWQIVSRGLIPKGQLPLNRIFGRSGPPRLVLLTCGGPFLPEYRSYRDNLVVIAEPVS